MKNTKKEIYAADFETNNHESDCHVWAWGINQIYTDSYKYGYDINSFFDYILGFDKSVKIYFHNEKFDGNFILSWLLNNGFKYDNNKKENTFYTVIDDMLRFYKISIFHKNKKGKVKSIDILDSMKKINAPLRALPKMFGIEIEKGNLDDTSDSSYNKFRPYGYIMNDEEKKYLYNDVYILSKALKFLYDNGLDSMTIAGGAMKEFKRMIGDKLFNDLFPVLSYDIDMFIRKSYRGGWTYCLKSQIVGFGRVFDVNSLYPSCLYSVINGYEHLYPRGQPVYYKGKYKDSKIYPLYFQRIMVDFRLKKGFLPTIQLSNSSFRRSQYIENSDGVVELVLNSIDLKMFLEHYDVDYIRYVDGYKFRAVSGVFDEYIDKFMDMKVKAGKEGNLAMRTFAKLYLNALYGKFAMSKTMRSKKPYLEDGIVKFKDVKYKIDDEEYDYIMKDGYYIPVASYCTAYAREVTITAAQKCYEKNVFCYADTDSIHILDGYDPEIPIDSFKLGFWDHESDFEKAIFIRSKTYAEKQINKGFSKWDLKCAGMPDEMKKQVVNYVEEKQIPMEEVFKVGFDSEKYGFTGKLRPKNVVGGQVLVNTPFKILERRS